MSTTTAKKRPARKRARIRRFLRHRSVLPWALSLAGVALLALILLTAAPGLLPSARSWGWPPTGSGSTWAGTARAVRPRCASAAATRGPRP